MSTKRAQGDTGNISPFETLATTLASTLGTGNIVGVSTAVALGGAGAVFWCWVTGIFGMATQYAECLLSVRYRVKNAKGEFCGGPMYVLERGVKSKFLGILYAVFAAGCGLLTGASIQANSISGVIRESIGNPRDVLYFAGTELSLTALATGGTLAVLTALVIFGGVQKISQVCSLFVPFMGVAYMVGCIVILWINRSVVPDGLKCIISSAFSVRSASAGALGGSMILACRYGVARGLFSNEAGVGTSSVVSANAVTPNPVRQALVSMTATFWDTVVMCLVTGVVVVSTVLADGSLQGVDYSGGFLCYRAFERIPVVGGGLLVFSMVTFAFSTILGWCFTGEKCAEYVWGEKAVSVYRFLWVLAVFISPVVSFDMVWNLADLCNALLVVPNVYSLLALSSQVKTFTLRFSGNTEGIIEEVL